MDHARLVDAIRAGTRRRRARKPGLSVPVPSGTAQALASDS